MRSVQNNKQAGSRVDRRRFLQQSAAGIAAIGLPTKLIPIAYAQPALHEDSRMNAALLRSWASKLKGELLLPDHATYDSARRIWNLAFDRRPSAIVRCADTQDVVRSIEFARTHDLEIAVRSGGHSFAGHSTVGSGLVIDLGKLNHIDVDSIDRVARVGPGVRAAHCCRRRRCTASLLPPEAAPTWESRDSHWAAA